jgi:DNA-directed RNA polymerase specialized sigma24 family protein
MRDFEQQWDCNGKRLRGLLVYLVKDIDLADDLLQETYLRAGRKIETYRGGDFGAWLAAIARSTALAHLRHE